MHYLNQADLACDIIKTSLSKAGNSEPGKASSRNSKGESTTTTATSKAESWNGDGRALLRSLAEALRALLASLLCLLATLLALPLRLLVLRRTRLEGLAEVLPKKLGAFSTLLDTKEGFLSKLFGELLRRPLDQASLFISVAQVVGVAVGEGVGDQSSPAARTASVECDEVVLVVAQFEVVAVDGA